MSTDATQGTEADWRQGYAAYQQGRKIGRGATSKFHEGWWAAADNRERFGPHDSFLAAGAS